MGLGFTRPDVLVVAVYGGNDFDNVLTILRLAAVMSADPEHEAAVLRVERLMSEQRGSYDDLR